MSCPECGEQAVHGVLKGLGALLEDERIREGTLHAVARSCFCTTYSILSTFFIVIWVSSTLNSRAIMTLLNTQFHPGNQCSGICDGIKRLLLQTGPRLKVSQHHCKAWNNWMTENLSANYSVETSAWERAGD